MVQSSVTRFDSQFSEETGDGSGSQAINLDSSFSMYIRQEIDKARICLMMTREILLVHLGSAVEEAIGECSDGGKRNLEDR